MMACRCRLRVLERPCGVLASCRGTWRGGTLSPPSPVAHWASTAPPAAVPDTEPAAAGPSGGAGEAGDGGGLDRRVTTSAAFKTRLAGLSSVADLMRLYHVRAARQLSQNFLVDPNACRMLATAAGSLRGAYVCEVGPGLGQITRPILAERPAALTVVERDARFVPALLALREQARSQLGVPVHIVAGDILRYNVDAAFGGVIPTTSSDSSSCNDATTAREPSAGGAGGDEEASQSSARPVLATRCWSQPVRDAVIIGNLPFNISTPLLIGWLRDISRRASVWRRGRVRMALTFQREVGERMVAEPGDRARRCRLSVMVQTYCHATYRHTLPGRLFVPRPDVDVAVMVLEPRAQPLIDTGRHSFERYERVVRAVFNTRAKHLQRAVANLFPRQWRRQLAADTLRLAALDRSSVVSDQRWRLMQRDDGFRHQAAGVGGGAEPRPYLLSTEEMVRLCDAYGDICRLHPELEQYDFRQSSADAEEQWGQDETLRQVVED